MRILILILWLILSLIYAYLCIFEFQPNSQIVLNQDAMEIASDTTTTNITTEQDNLEEKIDEDNLVPMEDSTLIEDGISGKIKEDNTDGNDDYTDGDDDYIEDTETRVESSPEKATIFFPANSKAQITSVNLETFLKELVQVVKGSDQKIYLTGHTDRLGDAEENIQLGLQRANAIKAMLIQYGVKPDRIITDSKGEAEPIGNNNTKEGRSKNRRVELIFK